MALNPARFTFPRALKSTLIAVGLVVASVSLWSPQLLDDFPLCMPEYFIFNGAVGALTNPASARPSASILASAARTSRPPSM